MKKFLILTLLVIPALSFALKPDSKFISHPDSIGIPSETHIVSTSDSAMLHVWKLLPPSERKLDKTIIVAYGDAGNKSYWLNQGALLSQFGFTVIMFDYRGFGKSSEFVIDTEFLYYEEFERDLTSIIKWTKENNKNDQIGIWALSMGTIISTQVLPDTKVDFLIAEGYVISPIILQERFNSQKDKQVKLPVSSNTYYQNLKSISTPMLIYAGTEDEYMTVSDSKEIATMNTNREVIQYEGGHLQGFRALTGNWFGEDYIKEIKKFTDANKK